MSHTLRQDANAAPVLETARLVLRLPHVRDLPANHRSHQLLVRMEAVVDPAAAHPYGDEPTQTWRHHAGGAA